MHKSLPLLPPWWPLGWPLPTQASAGSLGELNNENCIFSCVWLFLLKGTSVICRRVSVSRSGNIFVGVKRPIVRLYSCIRRAAGNSVAHISVSTQVQTPRSGISGSLGTSLLTFHGPCRNFLKRLHGVMFPQHSVGVQLPHRSAHEPWRCGGWAVQPGVRHMAVLASISQITRG